MPDEESTPNLLPSPPSPFVGRVAVKLPDFWTTDPDLWFLHAESAFNNARVTVSRTKFDLIVQKLPQDIMVSVRGLVRASATASTTPYEDLKDKLVSSYQLTRWQRVAKVIHHPGLGDRRPTALMDAMLALLPDDEEPGSIFLGLFLERLPVEMRDHLVAKVFKTPGEMALHADLLWDARRSQPAPAGPLLAAAVASGSPRSRDRDRRDSSPSRAGKPRVSTPGPSTSTASGYCHLHSTYGSRAHRCIPPCSYSGNASAGGRRRN